MTLITVICNDLIIFSRSKSRIFENSTLSPCGYFSEIPQRKNKFVFFRSALFTFALKLRDVKTKFIRFSRERTFSRRQKPNFREFCRKLYKSSDL